MEKNKEILNEGLVSIVMPAYNCADFISITLDSVLEQTYKNWEVIVIDDNSSDNTDEIVKKYTKKDKRIKLHKQEKNFGAAVARNTAVELARGKYIAFLDSDDVWFPDKLTKQISFMKENNYLFTCTSYTKIDENGMYLNRTIGVRKQSTYVDILKKNPGNSTVIYNAEVIGKVNIPNIRKRNDYVMWLSVVKNAGMLYGMEESLASHRIRSGSLSKKKSNLVKYHWKVYREIENLSVLKSTYLIIYWVVVTVFKLR
ncbi:glycosyltransferase family 2 protein [Alkalibacterium olivapovliticus]|uniref:Glycosyltransferase involved in cell wall biosynthesis n=1 Tax=Alkalibacterium olivapovliticus TaxID=99907 RepID=A0A2T0W7M3_9LACT|nr:glycosyltransferase family 2 protein [Alkalibacterium olivapovliticus]PRY82679.1 glycosyltransferase involved in cell wall biosynthesis [Alkalibacterium olivapovliticus]